MILDKIIEKISTKPITELSSNELYKDLLYLRFYTSKPENYWDADTQAIRDIYEEEMIKRNNDVK